MFSTLNRGAGPWYSRGLMHPASHRQPVARSGPCRAGRASRFYRRAAVRVALAAVSLVVTAAFLPSCAEKTASTGDSSEAAETAGPSKLAAVAEIQDLLARGIVGSAHDFTQAGGDPLDLCTPCHTPHIAAARAPLLDKRPQTLVALRPYQSLGVVLDDSSLLCLSCHDGVIASDVFSFAHATTTPGRLGTSWIGPGTLQSHPVGVAYPLADPKYVPIAGVKGESRIPLPGGRVQCISCHDPHNTHRHRGMLVSTNEGSRLCLSCHRI